MFAPASTLGLDGWAAKLVLIAITIVAAIIVLAVLRWVFPRLLRRSGKSNHPAGSRNRETAVALLATVVRYFVLIAAIVAILVILAGGGGVGAIGGSAIFAVIIGFASQRLLADMIAGFFILFEGQFGVGDVIQVEPSGLTGVVTEVGVRTTVMRDANGDRCYVPNSQITAVRRFPSARTMLSVTLLTREPEEAHTTLSRLGELAGPETGVANSAGAPRVQDIGGGVSSVRARVPVASMMVVTAQELVAGILSARLAGGLAADPIVAAVEPREAERAAAVVEA